MSGLRIDFAGALSGGVALALLVAGLALVILAYRRNGDRLALGRLVLLATLRGLVVVLLMACLTEPVLSYRASPAGSSPLVFLVDVSRSMSLRDTPRNTSRLEAALAPFTGAQALADRLGRQFSLEWLRFDAALAPLPEGRRAAESIKPEGEMTLLADALHDVGGRFTGQDLSGVILLTDGADQARRDAAVEARNLGAPVFVVAVGEVASAAPDALDVAVTAVDGERFMDAKVEQELVVRLEQQGCTGQTVSLELEHGGEVVASDPVTLTEASMERALRFVPRDVGKQRFEVVARPLEGEKVVENNRRVFSSIVSNKQIAVLFIEGTPRWEYKFVKRALERDPLVGFTGFIRSKGEVFLRQGEEVGSGALPDTVEAFAAFDVILLGDLAPDFLSPARQEALAEVVLEKGRGLGLLPGRHSLEGGGFGDTPLGTVLPALPVPDEMPIGEAFPVRITAEGKDAPLLAGLDFDLSPKLPGCFVLGAPSAAARVLMVHPFEFRDGAPLPVCVIQPAGKGRSMIMGTDSTWRWRDAEAVAGPSLHEAFWGQAVRWLAGRKLEGGGGVSFLAYASRDYYDPGQTAVLCAEIHREDGLNIEAEVTAEIMLPSGEPMTTPLRYVAGSPGLYRAELALDAPGAYKAVVRGVKEEVPLGEDDAAFFVGEPFKEFDRVAMNEALLRAVAFESDGAFHTPEDAEAIVGEVAESAAARARFVEKKLGRMPALYVALVLCATVEWVLRRRSGLL